MSIPDTNFVQICNQSGICNRDVDDSIISDRLKRFCPPGTYTWLLVRSMHYKFTQVPTQDEVLTRKIEYKTTNKDSARHFISIFFRQTEIETLSCNRVILGILGSENPKDQAEARSAFWQDFSIKLFVAMDGTYNYDISLDQGTCADFAASWFGKQKKQGEALLDEIPGDQSGKASQAGTSSAHSCEASQAETSSAQSGKAPQAETSSASASSRWCVVL